MTSTECVPSCQSDECPASTTPGDETNPAELRTPDDVGQPKTCHEASLKKGRRASSGQDIWVDVYGHSKLKRRILKAGLRNDKPRDGQSVTINCHGRLQDGKKIDEFRKMTFVLGENDLIQVFDLCVPMMEKGEVCEVVSHARYAYGSIGRYPDVPPFAEVTFHIELLDFTNVKSPLPIHRTLQLSEKKTSCGDRLLERHEYWRAIELYKKAIAISESIEGCHETFSLRRQADIRLRCYEGMSAAQVEVEAWDDASQSCGEVFFTAQSAKQHATAIFRSALCLRKKGDCLNAFRILKGARVFHPTDTDIINEMAKCQKILEETSSANNVQDVTLDELQITEIRQLQRPTDGVSLIDDEDQEDMITGDCCETVRAGMPCGHVIGPESLFEYCSSLLSAGKYELVCASCSAVWDYPIVRHVACLTDVEQQHVEHCLSMNYLHATQGQVNIKACPGCGWDCIIQGGGACGNMANCPVCTARRGYIYDFCWNCLKEWRDGSECNNNMCLKPNHGVLDRLKNSQTKFVGGVMCPAVRACPGCHSLIVHDDLCGHIQCPSCSYYFCFVCLKAKNPSSYRGLMCSCHSRECHKCLYRNFINWLLKSNAEQPDWCSSPYCCVNEAPRQTSLDELPQWRQYKSSFV